MTNPEELKNLFKQAAEIAEQVPESLRQVAFQRALDALLGSNPSDPSDPATANNGKTEQAKSSSSARIKKEMSERSGAVTHLLEVMNRSELAELMSGRKVLDRALLLLRAAQHHDIEELSANDIAQVLTQKFRESTTPQAVRMALDRSPSYSDRRPSGGSYQYSIMAPGERYLEASLKQAQKKEEKRPAVAQKKVRPKAHKSSIATAKTAKPRPGRSGRPGPKAALEMLIQEGYFKLYRTIGQIISHLEVKKTHRYSTSDFTATLQRLVRQSKLDRTRNSDGQYEYKTP